MRGVRARQGAHDLQLLLAAARQHQPLVHACVCTGQGFSSALHAAWLHDACMQHTCQRGPRSHRHPGIYERDAARWRGAQGVMPEACRGANTLSVRTLVLQQQLAPARQQLPRHPSQPVRDPLPHPPFQHSRAPLRVPLPVRRAAACSAKTPRVVTGVDAPLPQTCTLQAHVGCGSHAPPSILRHFWSRCACFAWFGCHSGSEALPPAPSTKPLWSTVSGPACPLVASSSSASCAAAVRMHGSQQHRWDYRICWPWTVTREQLHPLTGMPWSSANPGLLPAMNTALPVSIVPLNGCAATLDRFALQKGDCGSCSAPISRTLASKDGFPFIPFTPRRRSGMSPEGHSPSA